MTVLQGSIQLLRKTEVEFAADNPVLLEGQIAISSDNGDLHKVGDGVSTWSALSYAAPSVPVTSVFGRTGAVTAQNGDYTTSQVTEGSNLYYTAARFNTAFTAKTTSDLAEGSNLYYTSARFDSAFAAKTTDNLTEGATRLYHTAARVLATALTALTLSTSAIAAGDSIQTFAEKTQGQLNTTAKVAVANTFTETNTFNKAIALPTDTSTALLTLNGEKFMHVLGGSLGGTFQNLSIGYQAGNSLTALQTAAYANTIIGRRAGFALVGTTGNQGRSNILIGYGCAEGLTTGAFNTVTGTAAASGTTNFNQSSIYGWHAGAAYAGTDGCLYGYNNSPSATGNWHTSYGSEGFFSLTSSLYNTGIGYRHGYKITGEENCFGGYQAAGNSTGGNASYNTSWGTNSALNLRTGITNTDIGRGAGQGNVSGSHNVNLGANADNNASYDRTINIGRSTFCLASNQMNIGFTIYGADIYNAGARVGIGVSGTSITAALHIKASTTTLASLRIDAGVAPTSPNNGEMWFDGTDWFGRAGGVTYKLNKTAV